jgi:tRNA pseudouridine13 synthase
MSVVIHEREQDDADLERYTKRSKIDSDTKEDQAQNSQNESAEHILPPSHALLGIPLPVVKEGSALNILEKDVGISEYIGRGEAKVEGIIKQRLVYFHSLKNTH